MKRLFVVLLSPGPLGLCSGCTDPLAESSGDTEMELGEASTDGREELTGPEPTSLNDVDELPGTSLMVEVRPGEQGYVSLEDAEQVEIVDAQASRDWDIVFDDWNIYTNSGASGPGQCAAFGPIDALNFLFDDEPAVPFMRQDTPGGAFTGWYFYEGASHSLWSRFHTYGIDDGEHLYKVQITSYYGEEEGAPVSALYSMRYAMVEEDGSRDIVELDVDGTAGGPSVSDDMPSGCVDLSEGEVLMLTPEASAKSRDWDICFRRDTITTNGGIAGPGSVSGVDLQAADIDDETLEGVQARTSASELSRFEAIDYEALTADHLSYEPEGPVSIFADNWFEGEDDDIEPLSASWLVQAADGDHRFLMVIYDIQIDSDGIRSIEVLSRPVAVD